ncbi:MAG: methyltransferase domain-containing protein [Lutibacter sp.]|jgi:thiopurine S-methyltransferase|nr:methyltransferase domain-containing protein [Lutibacter sp.]
MNKTLDNHYWKQRYLQKQTGWNIGYPSPPLTNYCQQLRDKNCKILIPGVGKGYEIDWLQKQGFGQVYGLDITDEPLEAILKRNPSFPKTQLIKTDFFHHKGHYDLILEQTFFCALPPDRRNDYVQTMASLLRKNGKLCGVFFDINTTGEEPPFGGSLQEYETLFRPYFTIRVLERCYNSIKARQGNELFAIFEKK